MCVCNGVPPPLHFGVIAIEKGAFGSPSTKVANFTFIIDIYIYKRCLWFLITWCVNGGPNVEVLLNSAQYQ